MNTHTTTPVNRVLDTAKGAAFLHAVGDIVDTRTAQWAAIGDAIGLTPGIYAVESHSVKTPGKNYGKPTVRVISADVDALTAQLETAQATASQWGDAAWIKSQRAAAESRVASLTGLLARATAAQTPAAPTAPTAAPTAPMDVAALLADPAILAALLAKLTGG